MNKISVAFRPYAATDLNFIISSWLYGWENSPQNFGVHKHVYFKTTEVYIKETLKRSGALIACDPDEPDEIFGFVCAEYMDDETVFHWLHVKSSYRGFGVGRALFLYVHKHDYPPFTTSYCPRYDSVDEMYRKARTENEMTVLYEQVKNNRRKLPRVRILDDRSKIIGTVNKNSMIYSVEKNGMNKEKYKVIYSPLLIARLHSCNTTPIAKMVE